MGESRCSSQTASTAQTGLCCHGNRDRCKGQNPESKAGQNETVSEATAGAKEVHIHGLGRQFSFECPSAAPAGFGSCSPNTWSSLPLECLEGSLILLTSKEPFYNLPLPSLLAPAQTHSATRS